MNKYVEKQQKNANQMYRFDQASRGMGKFVEILEPNADFYKVRMNFCEYNGNSQSGNRMTSNEAVFFDVPYFLNLCRLIKSNEIFTRQGQNLADPFVRADAIKNRSVSFTLEKGDKGVFFKLAIGGARKGSDGRPQAILNNAKRVSVLCPWTDLWQMACICEVRIMAAIFRMELNGCFDAHYQGNNINREENQNQQYQSRQYQNQQYQSRQYQQDQQYQSRQYQNQQQKNTNPEDVIGQVPEDTPYMGNEFSPEDIPGFEDDFPFGIAN